MPAPQGAAGLLLLLGLALGLGCGRSPEVAERERVLHAIDALRDAPSVDARRRRGLLEELDRLPALTVPAAAARDACAAAYRPLLDGEDRVAEVRSALARGDDAAPDLPQKLHEAEAGVARARILMPGCERAVDELRRAAARPLP